MKFQCGLCGETYEIGRRHFPVISQPICMCNDCVEVIVESYQQSQYEESMYRKDMLIQIGRQIKELDLEEDSKKIMRKILNAYSAPDDEDETNYDIRNILDALIFGGRTVKARKLAESRLNDSFVDVKLGTQLKRIILDYCNVDCVNPWTDLVDMLAGYENINVVVVDNAINECALTHSCEEEQAIDKEAMTKSIYPLICKVKEFIKGQDEGVTQIGRLIYRHVMRCMYNYANPNNPISMKENFIVVGPTGVGKTATIEEFCHLLKIPCVCVDMTSLTKAGYVGDNISEYFNRLITLANNDIRLAERGIVILDEGDKNMKNSQERSEDPGGQSMMYEMLKKMEGSEISLGQGKFFNTKEVLFICMGTFVAAYEHREKRVRGKRMGFVSNIESEDATLGRFISDDFEKAGAPREWIGRFPCIVEFKSLAEQDMIDILHNSSKSPFMQNKKLMDFAYGIELTITPEGEFRVVKNALKYNIGARGLNRSISELLESVEAKLLTEHGSCKKVIIGETVTYE